MSRTLAIQLPPLQKKSMNQLIAEAEQLGIAPEDYARSIIEDSLAMRREAEASTFADIMKPVRKASGQVDDSEIIKLVERARGDHHRRLNRAKKR